MNRKDIYYEGKIYKGVLDGESRYNYPSIEVTTPHPFKDNEDVKGRYELKYQKNHIRTGWTDIDEWEYNHGRLGEEDRSKNPNVRIVATPVGIQQTEDKNIHWAVNGQQTELAQPDAVEFAEWLRTFEPLQKENNQWVLESQISSKELFGHYWKFRGDLNEALSDANNVKACTWSVEKSVWVIEYKNHLPTDYVPTEELIDFLYNA